MINLDYGVKEGMLQIAQTYAPGYRANLWCSPCVVDLVRFVYTQFDKDQPKPAA